MTTDVTGFTERLVAAGVPVKAIVNPLRGIAVDAAYVAGVIRQTAPVPGTTGKPSTPSST